MKEKILFFLLILPTFLFSQIENRTAITLGIFQGGGSLVGADLEVLLTPRLGIQGGAGLFGYGGALTFHLRPEIRSSMIAATYWHQGFGEGFTQDALGASFIYRGKKWFTAQLGLAATLNEGPAWPDGVEHPPVILLYSVGVYLVP